MAAHPKFANISDAIDAGLENLNKWYQKIDDTDVYFICLGACTVCSIFDRQLNIWLMQLSTWNGSLCMHARSGRAITLMLGSGSLRRWYVVSLFCLHIANTSLCSHNNSSICTACETPGPMLLSPLHPQPCQPVAIMASCICRQL